VLDRPPGLGERRRWGERDAHAYLGVNDAIAEADVFKGGAGIDPALCHGVEPEENLPLDTPDHHHQIAHLAEEPVAIILRRDGVLYKRH